MDAWLTDAADAVSPASGVPREELEPDAATQRTLLDLARVAAHASDARTNAPLLCYLAGIARAHGAPLETILDAITTRGR